MHYQTGEARLRRRRTKEAIALAMQGRWEEAVTTNRSIIEVFPKDVDAYNRLGKALTELGRYAAARGAYSKALEINPKSSIARRNLRRLSLLKEVQLSPRGDHHKVAPYLFIEETGKAGVASLQRLASREVLAGIAAGDRVYLRPKGQSLVVENRLGDYLGEVEPRIGVRLAKLMEVGNRYTAAITSLSDNEVRVIIKETFQHPSQAGRPSFPAKAFDGFRPYVKGSILKYELEEEEVFEEREYPLAWEEELEPLAEGASLLADDEDGDNGDTIEEE
ncbi:MAG: tetratricopeptide repeat protein [Dehalococcoidia bacterium]